MGQALMQHLPVTMFGYLLGIAIAFAWSSHLCIRTKLYIALAVLIISIVSYISAETYINYNKTDSSDVTSNDNGSTCDGESMESFVSDSVNSKKENTKM